MKSSVKRVEYLRKKKIFKSIGRDVTIMDRRIPLYANLITIHDNVRIASNVTFATHDVTHFVLNKMTNFEGRRFEEVIGCIEIMDNVFIGTNSTIIGDVRIGPNAIIAAGSVVSKDVPPNTVYGGVPARYICSFNEYVEKRKTNYPPEMAIRHQTISDKLVKYMWAEFEAKREKEESGKK